ncbi:hypothetical protein [Haloplanus sp. C73]|uniref:hypothetical protein n=1 Tax=Haloplanus sp. C73 TaxID=3421641 RepID=UPI003EB98A7E
MRIERETILIVVLIGLVLAPMWYFALASGEPTPGVQLQSDSDTEIAPTETFLPTPNEVNTNVSGVVTWLALFVLVAMIVYTRRFTERVGRATDVLRLDDAVLPSWLTSEHRSVLSYWPARTPSAGLITLGLLTWAVVAFAGLLAWEGLNYARTQFLGVYMGMMLLTMGVWMAVYTTWFMPSITVAERREH